MYYCISMLYIRLMYIYLVSSYYKMYLNSKYMSNDTKYLPDPEYRRNSTDVI